MEYIVMAYNTYIYISKITTFVSFSLRVGSIVEVTPSLLVILD